MLYNKLYVKSYVNHIQYTLLYNNLWIVLLFEIFVFDRFQKAYHHAFNVAVTGVIIQILFF